MKGRSVPNRGAPNDVLICFPARAHLSIMAKPICSPSRHSEIDKPNMVTTRSRSRTGSMFKTLVGNNSSSTCSSQIDEEPTSPKVNCAGQIKVRTENKSSRQNWLSVVEMLRNRERKKPHNWLVFLRALKGIRFHMNCLGSSAGSLGRSDDDDDDDEVDQEEEEDDGKKKEKEEEFKDVGESEKTAIFSKWFMVLEKENEEDHESNKKDVEEQGTKHQMEEPSVNTIPPKNALLLMRCRSAPTKGIAEEEEYKEREKERLILMGYDPDFFMISTDIAKETWVMGGEETPMTRCRSWRR